MPKINGPMITNRGAAGLLKRIPESLRVTLPKVEVLDPKAREGIDLIDKSLMPLAVDITTLVPDPDNARLHPERNMEAIKISLRTYGQKKPIVVRAEDMTVAAGNGTLQAAIELGWTVIAANVTPMTDEEFTGFALADNRTAELAAWNLEVVARLERLQAERGSGVIGWSEDEILALRVSEGSLNLPPQQFPEVDETIQVEHVCPKCSYQFSGGETIDAAEGDDELSRLRAIVEGLTERIAKQSDQLSKVAERKAKVRG